MRTRSYKLHSTGLSDTLGNAKFTVEVGGAKRDVTLKPAGLVEILPSETDVSWMPKEGWADMRDRAAKPTPLWLEDPKNLFWFEYLNAQKTLYTQVNQVGNKSDESLADFSKRLAGFIDSNPVEKIVLDFRLNRGGNGTLLRPLEIALIKSKIDQPGKLFVLMGRSTWSASQFFLDWMERNSNAVFVGEPSGSKGNQRGDSRRLTLPNSGITVRVSVYYWQHWSPWDTRLWTPPHVTAELSSMEYAANEDPVLRTALSYSPRKSLRQILEEALTEGGAGLAAKRFEEFKSEPENKYADTEEALLVAGQRLLNDKKPAEALVLFKLNEAENSHSFRAYFAVGVAYSRLGNKEFAIQNLQRSLELNPKAYDVNEALKATQATGN